MGILIKKNKLGINIMKEWNKKGGQRRKRGWMGVTQWKRLSFTVFISFRVIIFAQSKPSLMHTSI